MSKVIMAQVKMQLQAGKANPAPPVGTALGPHGVNMQEFCVKFNDATKDKGDTIVPVIVTIYEDRSFTFVLKSTPASVLIKKAINLQKGSPAPNKDKVGTITTKQLEEIAKEKMEDINANDIEQAVKIIAGTARSMGVKVEK